MPCTECRNKKTAIMNPQIEKKPCVGCSKKAHTAQTTSQRGSPRRIPLNTDYHETLPFILKKYGISVSLCSKGSRNIVHIKSENDDIETALYPFENCVFSDVSFDDKGTPRFIAVDSLSNNYDVWNNDFTHGAIFDLVNHSVLTDLCLPNSPTIHDDVLWFIESGTGRLCKVENEKIISVATIPAMASGLDFVGNLAFIGISPIYKDAGYLSLPIIQNMDSAEELVTSAHQALQAITNDENMTEESYSLALENYETAQEVYNNSVDSNGKSGLFIVDILRGEPISYFYVDSIDGIVDVKILPCDAIIHVSIH